MKFKKVYESFDDVIKKNKREGKKRVLGGILNRDNLMLNKYDKIEWSNGDKLLHLKTAYFDYGKGTPIFPWLDHKNFYFDYTVDFDNKTLQDKNFLGNTYILTDKELQQISNKFYWYKNR